MLLRQKSDFAAIEERLRNGSGKRLLNSKTEPPEDFDYCMRRNRFATILKRKKIAGDNRALELLEVSW